MVSLTHCTRFLTCSIDHQGAVRESTRDQVECKVPLRADIVNRLQKESNVKAMVYCASDPITSFSKVDIAFPHQVEIRVNQEEFKGNLRGLKNKPGSTRPADITGFLRPKADFGNILTVTYALTQKVCFLPCCLALCSGFQKTLFHGLEVLLCADGFFPGLS